MDRLAIKQLLNELNQRGIVNEPTKAFRIYQYTSCSFNESGLRYSVIFQNEDVEMLVTLLLQELGKPPSFSFQSKVIELASAKGIEFRGFNTSPEGAQIALALSGEALKSYINFAKSLSA